MCQSVCVCPAAEHADCAAQGERAEERASIIVPLLYCLLKPPVPHRHYRK